MKKIHCVRSSKLVAWLANTLERHTHTDAAERHTHTTRARTHTHTHDKRSNGQERGRFSHSLSLGGHSHTEVDEERLPCYPIYRRTILNVCTAVKRFVEQHRFAMRVREISTD